MPPVRSPVRCKKPVMKQLQGLHYACDAEEPSTVWVPTMIHPSHDGSANPRFPSFEAVLGVEAWIHETWVKVLNADDNEHRFLVAAQYCSECAINASLQAIWQETSWRGGLVVMRGGKYSSVIEMGGARFKRLAALAVRKYLVNTAPLVEELEQVSRAPAVMPAHI
ncbi:hypothetical protein GSI_03116 [Ganoderma sinense ZZ0214-1]|uniref:Uncharacterized protein n=1 Tax=Ganoderma sinense ZZ0214-1 TaxID=1077348 RepID=A0A2G8SKP9_9APHY|nr:hypothetical protein GSI_03116 [Ganoderma sinense ZZ0214-1]